MPINEVVARAYTIIPHLDAMNKLALRQGIYISTSVSDFEKIHGVRCGSRYSKFTTVENINELAPKVFMINGAMPNTVVDAVKIDVHIDGQNVNKIYLEKYTNELSADRETDLFLLHMYTSNWRSGLKMPRFQHLKAKNVLKEGIILQGFNNFYKSSSPSILYGERDVEYRLKFTTIDVGYSETNVPILEAGFYYDGKKLILI